MENIEYVKCTKCSTNEWIVGKVYKLEEDRIRNEQNYLPLKIYCNNKDYYSNFFEPSTEEAYNKKEQIMKLDKSDIGRYLKTLIDKPQLGDVTKGEYGKIIKIDKDSTGGKADFPNHTSYCFTLNSAKYELMPKGWTPDKELTSDIIVEEDFKSGDWIVITNFGRAVPGNSFSLNKTYQLNGDYSTGLHIAKDDNGSKTNGWHSWKDLGGEVRRALPEEIPVPIYDSNYRPSQGEIFTTDRIDTNEFIIGRYETKNDSVRCIGPYISNFSQSLGYYPSKSWCYENSDRKTRPATSKEREWLEACIKANKFIPLEEVKKQHQIPKYVECLENHSNQFTAGKIYQTRSDSTIDYYYIVKDDKGKDNGWGSKYFISSTKETFDNQNKPKTMDLQIDTWYKCHYMKDTDNIWFFKYLETDKDNEIWSSKYYNNRGSQQSTNVKLIHFRDASNLQLADMEEVYEHFPEERPVIKNWYIKYSEDFSEDLYNQMMDWIRPQIIEDIYWRNWYIGEPFEKFKHGSGLGGYFNFRPKQLGGTGVDNNSQRIERQISISELKTIINYKEFIIKESGKISLKGRYLKVLNDSCKRHYPCCKGDYLLFVQEDSKGYQYWGHDGSEKAKSWYHGIEVHLNPDFELMPEGFNPESKPKYSSIIEEAKARYPIGTQFLPAHVPHEDQKNYCTVTNLNFKEFDNGNIAIFTDDNKKWNENSEEKYGKTCLDRYVYYSGKWAEIISKPAFDQLGLLTQLDKVYYYDHVRPKKVNTEEQLDDWGFPIEKKAPLSSLEECKKRFPIGSYYRCVNGNNPDNGKTRKSQNHVKDDIWKVTEYLQYGKNVHCGNGWLNWNGKYATLINANELYLTDSVGSISNSNDIKINVKPNLQIDAEITNVKVQKSAPVTLKNTESEVKINVKPSSTIKI